MSVLILLISVAILYGAAAWFSGWWPFIKKQGGGNSSRATLGSDLGSENTDSEDTSKPPSHAIH